jgi:hypothetical protein
MSQRGKTNQMQTNLFDDLDSSEGLILLEVLAARKLELETAIGELLLSAIGKAEARKGAKHDA